jgi:glycosyltransferase involved in cell wall biosynthesis
VLTGFIRGRKLHSLLTNALCYSLPSSHEGLPIALLEAMSYRLPVVTSAIPANLEVGLNQECYHAVGDVEALAKKLDAIICKPLQRIDYDMSKYDWDVIAGQVSEIYQSMYCKHQAYYYIATAATTNEVVAAVVVLLRVVYRSKHSINCI